MSAAWVVFRPLDAVVFRDGRPFSAGMSASARTAFPRPSSTAGAITAVFGGVEPRQVIGPLVVDLRPTPILRFPSPSDLVFEDSEESRAQRLSPDHHVASVASDLDDDEDCDPGFKLLGGRGDPASALVTAYELQEYFEGVTDDLLDALKERRKQASEPFGFGSLLKREPRLGLARDGRSAQDGFLYAAEFLRFRTDTSGFACRVFFDGDIPEPCDLVRLGGEARQAEVSLFAGDADEWLPSRPAEFPGGRLLLYLATPAIFTRGWIPDPVPDSEFAVVGACLPAPEVAASWSVGQDHSNPVRWAVAAGGVYFLRFGTDQDAQEFAGRWHGKCLPQAHQRLRTAGFGMCLTGRW